ncbi:MAG: hypothetical protein ABI575_00645 [Oxalobacteraceae bacterium]
MMSGLLALTAHYAGAQDVGTPLPERSVAIEYPAGSITTIDAAQAARQQAASEKARVEQQYAQDEQACGAAFFVNACRDKVKESRRAALEAVRQVEIEADTLIRRIHAAGKDQALGDRRLEKAVEAVRIEQDARQRAQETAQKQARNAQQSQQRMANEQLHLQDAAQRTADHQARQQHPAINATAEVQKRAANVAAYEEKIRKAQAHQRDLAAKKAEKNHNRKTQPATVLPVPAAVTPNG